MKSLRKSLNGNRESSSRPQISVPLPTVSKPPSAILPPQKVIRALSHYRSQAPQELSFVKGDFFYVLKDVDTSGAWYEAHNPVSGARGLVPRSMFEEFGKNAAETRASQAGLPSPRMQPPNMPPPTMRPPSEAPATNGPKAAYYAIVLHDFNAERTDELDAKRGDAISVVAQSNREWFVAKPIGRLGRPGLIPVSFVEIRDPVTGVPVPDVDAILEKGVLPKVEDWKRAMLSYKQNSISLGVIDAPKPPSDVSQYEAQPTVTTRTVSSTKSDPPRTKSPETLPEGILISADVVSFHYEMEDYWFRVDAIFQPYGVPGQSNLPPSKQLILFRQYNDFYDFQVSLLESFPREAGREPPEPRTLPFMPGPASEVDDELTATRRSELDDYVHALCALGKSGGRYILEHPVVRKFLSLKPGDVENEGPPKTREIDALFANDPLDDSYDPAYDIQEQMGRMNVQGGRRSVGSDYQDEGYGGSSQRNPYDNEPNPYHQQRHADDMRFNAHAKNHSRSGSSTSFNNSYGANSRSNSPRNHSPQPRQQNGYGSHSNGQHGHQASTSSRRNDSGYQTEASRTSQAISSRSRSHSTATPNLNTPPISAANPQTAFVKIKVFNQHADDLIAIRVHPKISHTDLMDKVQTRLATEVGELRYRDSMTNTFVGLDSDDELRAWIEGTDKHVLFAD